MACVHSSGFSKEYLDYLERKYMEGKDQQEQIGDRIGDIANSMKTVVDGL